MDNPFVYLARLTSIILFNKLLRMLSLRISKQTNRKTDAHKNTYNSDIITLMNYSGVYKLKAYLL